MNDARAIAQNQHARSSEKPKGIYHDRPCVLPEFTSVPLPSLLRTSSLSSLDKENFSATNLKSLLEDSSKKFEFSLHPNDAVCVYNNLHFK